MKFEDIDESLRDSFNQAVGHPLQSFEWGQFREGTGVKVIRRGQVARSKLTNAYQLTIHKAPLGFNIGYLPKGNLPNEDYLLDLSEIGKTNNCVYIQLEPNVPVSVESSQWSIANKLRPSFHPLITKYTFVLDLEKSEEDLLSGMHPKTRYNIRVAQKHGVEISEDNSKQAFEKYLELTWATTKRQGFYAHNEKYHRKMWETLQATNSKQQTPSNKLSAHLFTAKYKGKILTTWIVFIFKDTLYYPYGASSEEFREVMANNLMAWEVIKYGKSRGLKNFDMWGALGEDPDPKDPWYGFHRFKKGYGAKLVESVGSYDLVINPTVYGLFKVGDKARWLYLGLRKKL